MGGGIRYVLTTPNLFLFLNFTFRHEERKRRVPEKKEKGGKMVPVLLDLL